MTYGCHRLKNRLNSPPFRCVYSGVKTQSIITRLKHGATFVLVLVALGASVSCMTTYDAAGRPVQSVDPGVAVAGAAAAGLAGYAIGSNRHDHYYYGGGHHRRPYYGGYHRGRRW